MNHFIQLVQQLFPEIDFNQFGRFVQFSYHYEPERKLYCVVQNVYSGNIKAICLNYHSDDDIVPFARSFYFDHIVGKITDIATGEILEKRVFYERYIAQYYPDRKIGYTVTGLKTNDPQICFTGFVTKRKAELKEMAQSANLWVTQKVTKNLKYLVCGGNAGPKKIEEAKNLGAIIWSENDFLDWLENQKK